MPFAADDVYAGMIAYFRVKDLVRHRRIRNTARTMDDKPRPFICYAVADGLTYWTCFTGTPKPWRRAVPRKWLRHPPGRWSLALTGDLIISDAADSFVGPADAFAECSQKYDEWKGRYRPMLLPEGVVEVQMMVSSRRGLLPRVQQAASQMLAA